MAVTPPRPAALSRAWAHSRVPLLGLSEPPRRTAEAAPLLHQGVVPPLSTHACEAGATVRVRAKAGGHWPLRKRRRQRALEASGIKRRSQSATRTQTSSNWSAFSVGERNRAAPAPQPLCDSKLAAARRGARASQSERAWLRTALDKVRWTCGTASCDAANHQEGSSRGEAE